VLYSSSTVSNEQGPLHRCLDVVKNKQGFSHLRERVWVKKLVRESKIRFGTWNIGTLVGKSMKVVDSMTRRRINFMCPQETKWVGKKAKELDSSEFKLWYNGEVRSRNGVGIIVNKEHEVKEVLKRMSNGKAVGPDNIPIEVWKSLGDRGIVLLTKLFNKIMRMKEMSNKWRRNTLIPIYKNKEGYTELREL